MLEDPLEKEKISTRFSKSLIIDYERKDNLEKNTSPNKKNEKKKCNEDELSTLYISKTPFSATLEANTPSPFTKKGVHMDEMMKLFK